MTANAATLSNRAADPYWSRLEDHWEAVDRCDPVIWGEAAGPWSREVVDAYAAGGYHFASGLFSTDEAATLLHEANQLAATADRKAPGVISEPGSGVVRSVFRIHRDHEVFAAVCRDPRIVEPVRQMLGGDVYIHQSRINYKPAFDGKEFFWHSDFETWHVEDGMPRMRAVSVSIALTENNEFNGPLMVVPGSHRLYVRCVGATPENHFEQSLKKQEYGVPSRDAMQLLVERGGIVAPKGPAGSALFFDCNLMHGSVGNLSPYPRTNLFVVFNSVDNPVVEPFGGQPPRPDFLAERSVRPIEG